MMALVFPLDFFFWGGSSPPGCTGSGRGAGTGGSVVGMMGDEGVSFKDFARSANADGSTGPPSLGFGEASPPGSAFGEASPP